jgi:hypothetical protein
LAPAVTDLLADPARLASLSGRGRSSAAGQLDWDGYVGRVAAALDAVATRSPDDAAPRAALGAHLDAALAGYRAEAAGLRSEADPLQAVDIPALNREITELRTQRDRIPGWRPGSPH